MARVESERGLKLINGAINRINYLSNAFIVQPGDVVIQILEYYQINKERIQCFGPQQKMDIAMKLLTKDLLISNAYDAEGSATKYLRQWKKLYGNIDLTNYDYIGMEINEAVEGYLAPCCFDKAQHPYQSQVISEYLQKFSEKDEEPPILVSPSSVYIEQNKEDNLGVYISYSTSFCIPYGGNDSSVTVYVNRYHEIGRKLG